VAHTIDLMVPGAIIKKLEPMLFGQWLYFTNQLVIYKKQKIFSDKQNDLGMACHIPPLKKAKKQGEMPLPSLGPIPLKECRI